MTSLTLSAAIQIALLGTAAGADTSYATAHQRTAKTGQPLVVLVGAKWCPACVQMKRNVVPHLQSQGSLNQVSYAEVDLDRQRELGRLLTEGGPIPQLLMYRKTKIGWKLRRIIGSQSVDKVDRFIAEGVALDKASKAYEASLKLPNHKTKASTPQQPGNPSTSTESRRPT